MPQLAAMDQHPLPTKVYVATSQNADIVMQVTGLPQQCPAPTSPYTLGPSSCGPARPADARDVSVVLFTKDGRRWVAKWTNVSLKKEGR